MPKKELCPGGGQIVFGPDEPDGTVFCSKCGMSFLPMKTTIKPDGTKEFSVSPHDRLVPPRRRVKSQPNPRTGGSGRDSGRRR